MAEKTVREIALERPESIRVFEQFGIDYCCGGRKPLSEACAQAAVDEAVVLAALAASQGAKAPERDWTAVSLQELVAHVVETHHAYLNRELPRLAALAERVVSRHGDKQPELKEMAATLAALSEELRLHLTKEECILFPHIVKMELARAQRSQPPSGCFGAVEHPIAMMLHEHDSAGEALAKLRALSRNYAAPEWACPTYKGFFQGLKELEADLHQHTHKENNILFPCAVELEKEFAGAPTL